ncbi:tellurite resistance protein-like permease [Mycobacterium sp. JS623]|uniref:tellurite resistance/C4-dicarboxylate transporter family protein n=1 Tax=Mycobacterium sp. JS623 TaxID=212767 RepID=UPI0002A58BCB|nr:tellurite resistance/C4-dicarboxylate transporter family protein [Mycobacterium sp. JS623]AGB25833.1 tellurite resistance protein-like permease [Mycobacterium sp. JS623]
MKPDSFAAVMATGIVSIAAADHGFDVISGVLIVLAAVALPVLIVGAAVAWRRASWKLTDLDVSLRLCTYVAACAVVGARLAEHRWVLWALAGMALQGWVSLAPMIARRMWCDRRTLRFRARGGWELASVATSGVAILMADLRILFWALVLWAVAIVVYLLMTGLIGWRAVHDSAAPELAQPDIWILMGGAAIATLAGDHIHKAGLTFVWPVTVATWFVATAWIPVLIYVVLRRRVGLAWPAVFPLGMYASATFATAVETGWRWLTTVSLVFFLIALAAWVFTALQALSRIGSPPPPAGGTRLDLAT